MKSEKVVLIIGIIFCVGALIANLPSLETTGIKINGKSLFSLTVYPNELLTYRRI